MSEDPAQLDKVFAEAMALSAPADRADFLDQVCRNDEALRDRVDVLLAAHDAAGSFLELPPGESTVPFVSLTERPGTTIGRYKLLEQIGEGGFGVVFMAEQEQPVRRRVALKVIKLGMDTKQVVARFEAERQALAMMDHPNIAKVFDAGSTEAGRPFFVMELVRGVPITEYCDTARLSTNDRLALFQQVCAAVQHAHQKGIIHRDLKPSNVLVTLHDDKAVPKVIDFGVAKATQARLTERTLFTEFRQMVGTPTYMSPEQAHMSGLDVDTRSDVYSLGVLLYELLTGTTPIEPKRISSATYDDLRRLICEVDPPSPSARLSTLTDEALTTLAKQRHCEPRELVVSLRSDLDWIVMKCLEKDRTRRYESATSLAQDLQRYLDGEPIEARPPTRWYRTEKFIRKNKTGVFVGTTIFAALITGLALASVGMTQARRQAAIAKAESIRSEQVAKFLTDMLSAVQPAVALGRDTVLLRDILDNTSNRVTNELNDQPLVQVELLDTLATTYDSIGDTPRAMELTEKAVAIYSQLFGQKSSQFATALSRLGLCQVRCINAKTGHTNAYHALTIARQSGDQRAISFCLQNYAHTFDSSEVVCAIESIPYIREALAIEEALNDSPERIATLTRNLGILLTDNRQSKEGEPLLRQHLEFVRTHFPVDHCDTIGALYLLAQNQRNLQNLVEAESLAREAFESSLRIFPQGTVAPGQYFKLLMCLLVQRNKFSEAVELCQQFGAFDNWSIDYWMAVGECHAAQGDFAAAVKDFSKARDLAPTNPGPAMWLALVLLEDGRIEEYRNHIHEYLALSADTENYIVADMAAKSALLLPVEGADFETAVRLADLAGSLSGPNEWRAAWTRLVKALAEYRRQDFDSAISWSERCAKTVSVSQECQAAALCIQAGCYAQQKKWDLARDALLRADSLSPDLEHLELYENEYVWADWAVVRILRDQVAQLMDDDAAFAP